MGGCDEGVYSDPNRIGDAVGCLRDLIGQLKKDIKGVTKETSNWVSKIGDGDSLFKSIGNSVAGIYKNNAKFASDLNAQYKVGEEIAKTYKQTSISIGISANNQKAFGKTFTKSLQGVQELGGGLDDVKSIYTKFSSESGRVRILDPEEVQRIYAIEKATGLMGDSAAALAERFDAMGVGSEGFSENITNLVADSQKMGLNSSKVVGKLSDNFKQMQNMSFKGGVKGMSEMAKLSVKMKMEISDMLSMADKFYEPEAAIEASANLQMLGGDVAAAFGDPIQLMYEARNAPEELAKRVGEVTKNMMQFNKETGEFEMPPEARMQIQSMAESLGLNKDEIIDTARQMSKMSQIKMDIGGNMFDDDQQEKIASLAKFDKTDQKWKVDVGGEAVAVQDLNTAELEEAMKAPSTEQDAIMMTAKEAMTTNELLTSIVEQFQTGIVLKTGVYEKTAKNLDPQIGKMQDTNQAVIDASFDAITKSPGFKDLSKVAGSVAEITTTMSAGFQDMIQGNMEFISDSLEKMDIETIKKEMTAIIRQSMNTDSNIEDIKDPEIPVEEEKDFIMRKGQPAVSFTSEDDMFSGKAGGPIAGSLAQIYEKINQPIEIPKINIPSSKSPVGGESMKIEPLTGNILIGGKITVSNEDGSATSQMDLEKYKRDIETKIMDKVYDVMADNWDGKNGGRGTGVVSVPM